MAAAAAFVGILLTSLLVAELAALSLGDFFGAAGELLLVIAGVAAFATFALIVFAVVYARAEHASRLNGTAVLLVLLAIGIVAAPGVVPSIASHPGNPLTADEGVLGIALQLLVPSLLAVLVQWGLVLRLHLRAAGADDLTLWPWVTTGIAALVVLSPFGLAFLQTAMKRSAGGPMWQSMSRVTVGAACVLIVMAAAECYIRARLLRRRRNAPINAPAPRVARALV